MNSKLENSYTAKGSKITRHSDVIDAIKKEGRFIPLTVYLAPTEACESDCPFCSVGHRDISRYLEIGQIEKCIKDFASLGCKALQITGGGNPLIYRDKKTNANVNSIIRIAAEHHLEVGVISNSHDLSRIDTSVYPYINWIRISLIKLDEGKNPQDYNFASFPQSKIGLSYIHYNDGGGYQRQRFRNGSSNESLRKIFELADIYPNIKFIRIAPDATPGCGARDLIIDNPLIKSALLKYRNLFVQGINADTLTEPFNNGCYAGALRPFVASSPCISEGAMVYACHCHTHFSGWKYNRDFALCYINDVIPTWQRMAENFQRSRFPYELRGNVGANWTKTCQFCYYSNNNSLLHQVINEDRDYSELTDEAIDDENFI